MFYIILLVLFLVGVFAFFASRNKEVEQTPPTKEEQFLNELADAMGTDFGQNVDIIEKPRTKEEWARVNKICDKYGYDARELFKYYKDPFFKGAKRKNINMYYWTGTLKLKDAKKKDPE